MRFYEMIFECTETCQNGNERRIKRSVYSPCFRNGKHIVEIDRVNKAIKELEQRHYYDIKYIETKSKELIFTSDIYTF